MGKVADLQAMLRASHASERLTKERAEGLTRKWLAEVFGEGIRVRVSARVLEDPARGRTHARLMFTMLPTCMDIQVSGETDGDA